MHKGPPQLMDQRRYFMTRGVEFAISTRDLVLVSSTTPRPSLRDVLYEFPDLCT